ncbi:MAG: chemotaxis protein CheR [Desulfuromonas sp.]|uniref:CheR family methyltransferase n=1 Tax=Desulfuromonas sp. TaxID=892 RepID=UPI000CB7BB38|nr:protein-glutamate O-methyltransferase [Desulfuromonas sp.]PLX84986.1 MAG: chemotaxis protein CheR [Desulfuromonas sp.]
MNLATKDFQRLSTFIYDNVGIKMPPAKRTMLEGRLAKRLRSLGLKSYGEYCDFLFSDQGQQSELIHMIDVVTTNKTDFFREPSHFDFLSRTALPDLVASLGIGGPRKLRLWSAGCSTGEEPYTLSMVLSEFRERQPELGLDFRIVATDISTRVLEVARRAVYHHDRIEPVPAPLRKKYLLRSRDRQNPLVRVHQDLRTPIRFGRLNFMDPDFGFRERMDVIFCRNVIIYFDKATQERLLQKFCRYLNRGGYVFLGHSESLHGFDVPLEQVAPTVFRYSL